ncbi:MAG: helix-turn-helix domain-containing protein [Armatimonadetes bacterium]|nr:helix-turn-helix domain-containing protein [Armatimonadota bacterium]
MPRPRNVADHLTVAELEQRFRACACRAERTRLQAIWLAAKGWSTETTLEATGLGRTTFQMALRHDNAVGPDGLRDHRHDNQGPPRLVRGELRERLLAAVEHPPPDGGLWSGRKVADWLAAELGRPVHEKQGWRALKAAQEAVKKGLSTEP